jgi:hypothetical protein
MQTVATFKNYFGAFNESAIKNNFVLIYELLDGMGACTRSPRRTVQAGAASGHGDQSVGAVQKKIAYVVFRWLSCAWKDMGTSTNKVLYPNMYYPGGVHTLPCPFFYDKNVRLDATDQVMGGVWRVYCTSPRTLFLLFPAEMLDFGFPQRTEPEILKMYITQVGVKAPVCSPAIR